MTTNHGAAVELNEQSSVATRTVTVPTITNGDGAFLFLTVATGNVTFVVTDNGMSHSFTAVGAAVATTGYTTQLFKVANLASGDTGKIVTIKTQTLVSGVLTDTVMKVSGGLRVLTGTHLTDIVDTYTTKMAGATLNPSSPGLTTTALGCGQIHFVAPIRASTTLGPQLTTLTVNSGQGVTDDFSAFTGSGTASMSACAVAYDYTPLALGAAIGSKAFTADQAVGYSAWTVSVRPSNAAPIVDAGPNQVVQAGATVTMAGTASDLDGTISTTVWSFNAETGSAYPSGGSAPSLTNGSTLTASWTAPALAGDYTLRLRVTDNGGAVTDKYVVVTVTTTSSFPNAITSAGTFTNVGGAASILAALADSSDTTYAESGAAPSGDTLEVEHQPTPAGAKTVKYDLQGDSASPTTSWVVQLVQGSTIIRSWDETAVGTTIIRRTRVLTSSENAAITDPTNLSMRYTVTED